MILLQAVFKFHFKLFYLDNKLQGNRRSRVINPRQAWKELISLPLCTCLPVPAAYTAPCTPTFTYILTWLRMENQRGFMKKSDSHLRKSDGLECCLSIRICESDKGDSSIESPAYWRKSITVTVTENQLCILNPVWCFTHITFFILTAIRCSMIPISQIRKLRAYKITVCKCLSQNLNPY